MGDASSSDTEAGNHADAPITKTHNHLHPFGGAEFQVSHLLERLEAGVNAQGAENVGTPPREVKKVSKDSSAAGDEELPTMDDVLRDLEELVFKCDALGEGFEPPLLPTDHVVRSAIIAHSISVLLQRLERAHAVRLGTYIADETTQMITDFFRLPNYSAFYHTEQLEGLVRITRMLLHHAYPRYLEDGALAFSSRMPCIYSSVASPLGIVQHLCRQLGLPLACVRPVPVDASGRGMDTKALDRLCEEDLASGRTPLLVLGEAGAQPLGCGSDLRTLQECCARRKLYLHLRGHALALPAVYPSEQVFNVAESLTLTPALWFGITGLPNVTLYRIPEPIVANDISKVTNSSASSLPALSGLSGGAARLASLPLWVAIRLASPQRLQQHLASAFRSVKIFHNIVASFGLRILSTKPGEEASSKVELLDAVSSTSGCVCFQFASSSSSEMRPPPYFDKLNSWLGQVLQREPDMVPIEVCETEAHGIVLRFCPLEGTLLNEMTVELISSAVESQVRVLEATVSLRGPFQQRVNETKGLELLTVPGWAGLGGVRYVPPGWENAPENELNALNKQLVDTLRATDNAFSWGEAEDGRTCVRFGMVTADTDIEELLDLLLSAGREVEESSRALTNMSEVLKKSISAAEEELERSRAAQGVLRLVPVVGRVVEWWAPARPLPGRSLHLPTSALTPSHTDRVIQIQQDKVQSVEQASDTPPRSSLTPQPPPQ